MRRCGAPFACALVTAALQAALPELPAQSLLACVALVPLLVALDGAGAGAAFGAVLTYALVAVVGIVASIVARRRATVAEAVLGRGA